MTYGEQWYANKLKIENSHGFKLPNLNGSLPAKMKHEDAVNYYNQKLIDYWVQNHVDKKIPEHLRESMVRFYIFGDDYKNKILKDANVQ